MPKEDFDHAIEFLEELFENARRTKDGQVYIGMHSIGILIRILKDSKLKPNKIKEEPKND